MAGFYDIKAKKLSGEVVSLADYRGKIVLVENTASLWGTTVRDFTQMNELCEKVSEDMSVIQLAWKYNMKQGSVTIVMVDSDRLYWSNTEYEVKPSEPQLSSFYFLPNHFV